MMRRPPENPAADLRHAARVALIIGGLLVCLVAIFGPQARDEAPKKYPEERAMK
jgi:hypothetical protein